MDEIDGIPLFTDLFAPGPLFLNTTSFTGNNTASANAPAFPSSFGFTMLSVKEIANDYYKNNALQGSGNGVTIYSDPENDPDIIVLQEVVIESNKYYADFKDLEIILFASRNGALLLEQYFKATITPKQIVLFLEIDDSTNFFGSVMRIKVGSAVEKMDGLPFAEISNFVRSKKVELEPEDIEKFIKGGIDATKPGILKFLVKAVSYGLRFTSFAFDGLATFFNKTIPEKLDFFRLSDERWNGEDLLFIPRSITQVLQKAKEGKNDKVLDAVFSPFYKITEGLCTTANECADLLHPIFPGVVYKRLQLVISNMTAQIADIKKYTKENSTAIAGVLLTSLKMFNAMLCGFVNSIVDFVKGIFQIIGMIFKITAEITDAADNAVYYTDYISEIIENFIGAIVQVDYAAFFKEMIQAPIKLYNSFSNFLKNGIDINIDLVSAAYYYGYIIGLIVQIIVEILLTGGTVTIAKIAEYFKAPFIAIANLIKASAGAAKTIFQRVLNFISYLVNKLRKPKQLLEDFIKFVDELINGAREEAGIADNIIGDGLYGGKILSDTDLENWAKMLNKKFGTIIERVEKFENANILAQFDPNTNTIKYTGDVTEYLIAHESYHAEEMYTIGFDEYVKDAALKGVKEANYTVENWQRLYKREKYVYDKLIKNAKRHNLNIDELNHAFYYFDGRIVLSLEKLKIKIPKI